MVKKIAVIGSGISGLVSANLLSQRYAVTVFEANDYLGGHTHTVDVQREGDTYPIDTGFIVFNKKTYPHFCKLLAKHHIPIQKSEMSFSYHSRTQPLEYNGHSLNTLFADRRNFMKPRFYHFISEILRFNQDAKQFLSDATDTDMRISEFIERQRYSKQFINSYLLPMMAAIWSKKHNDVLNCSTYFILKFYANHGLLEAYDRPEWYVVANGSRSYIEPIIQPFKQQIFLNTKIESIERKPDQVILKSSTDEYIYDAVVIATHSDQALRMLAKPSNEEEHILSAIKYTENEVLLHTDSSIMPKRRLAWASWNYLDNGTEAPSLTYYANRLQSIKSRHHFYVSVNLNEYIASDKIIKRLQYSHPCFNVDTLKVQQQKQLINDKMNTYYAGAYWGYGFHEDGVKSAMNACEPLGVVL